jgi:serine/threonine protein kinase
MGQAGSWRTCAHCGTLNAATEQFCTNCGYALTGGPASQSQGVSPPVTVAGAPGRRVTGALVPRALLGGRYRIVQALGKGGFGAVYKAVDTRFQGQRVVAIKEMSDAQLSQSERAQALQDFRHEANLLVQLNHPYLPNVSDFFEEAGKAYLVMEFVEGTTLEKKQEQAGGPLDESLVMGWALQLCTVLHYLHTRPHPIIFRDMKPSNVMVTDEGEIKLIDFGIARMFKASATKDTTLLGSVGYAPLEQYGRGQSDARSDIYALGATLYDLLTKEMPADAPTRRVNPQAFIPPRQLNPAITPSTEAIVLKAMGENPQDRYQSAAEMAQAIVTSGIVQPNSPGLPTSGPLLGLPISQPLAAYPTTPHGLSPAPAAPLTSAPGKKARASAVTPPTVTPRGPAAPAHVPGQPGKARISRRGLLIGGATVVGAAAVGGAGLLFFSRGASKPPSSTTPTGTIPITLTYSTEKDDWMRASIAAFHRSNTLLGGKAIQVTLDPRGSIDAQQRILSGSLLPAAWSPASALELNQLSTAWRQAHSGQDIIVSSGDLLPASLVFSPLVFVVWKERAQVLLRKYGSIDWPGIHDALVLKNGWADIGGQADWGQVKFGQTRPDQSNSGLLSITLLAYAFYKEQRGLTVDQVRSSTFLAYFSDVEGAVTQFGRSSGTYLENEVILKGPAAYDITTTYENLVLTREREAMQRQGQLLLPFYPGLNIVSDHPFAILQGQGITAEAQMAAKALRDFLLAEQQQRQALLSGFRPTNPNVHITDKLSGNPFLGQSSDIQIKTQIQPLAQAPNGDVINELIKQWSDRYQDASTSPS